MDAGHAALLKDNQTLRAALEASEARAFAAEAEATATRAQISDRDALIAHLKLQIEKLRRQIYGPHSERTARLLDQLELQLEEVEASATEDELAAEAAATRTTSVAAFTHNRPARKSFPRASVARAGGLCGADRLRLLRRGAAAQAG
jgi:transposase